MNKDKIEHCLDKFIEYLLYAMILIIPFSKAGIEIMFSLTVLSFIFKKTISFKISFLKDKTHFFLLLFFIFSVLSLINSGGYIKKSLLALFAKWAEYILIFIIAEDTLNTPGRVRNTIIILLVSTGVLVFDALYQNFNKTDFFCGRPLVGTIMTGAYENKNNFASELVFPILILIPLFFEKKNKQIKLVLGLFLFFLGLCLLQTLSRGAWVGLTAGLILIFILSRKIRRYLPIFCLIAVILVFLPFVQQRLLCIFAKGGDSERIMLAMSAIKMIKDNPFLGKGLGTFMDYCPKYTATGYAYHAHNCFLQIWAEAGLFAFLSFLLFVGAILYRAVRSIRRNFNFLLLGLTCAIVGALVNSAFDTALYSLQLSAMFWSMLGLLNAAVSLNSSEYLNQNLKSGIL